MVKEKFSSPPIEFEASFHTLLFACLQSLQYFQGQGKTDAFSVSTYFNKQEEIENKIEVADALAVKLLQRFNYSVSAMKTTSNHLSEGICYILDLLNPNFWGLWWKVTVGSVSILYSYSYELYKSSGSIDNSVTNLDHMYDLSRSLHKNGYDNSLIVQSIHYKLNLET